MDESRRHSACLMMTGLTRSIFHSTSIDAMVYTASDDCGRGVTFLVALISQFGDI